MFTVDVAARLTGPPERVHNGCFRKNAGVTQLVECDLAKVDVAGSNPVSRSKFSKTTAFAQSFRNTIETNPYKKPSTAEWHTGLTTCAKFSGVCRGLLVSLPSRC